MPPPIPYTSEILSALEDLKDHQTGSTASSIVRRIADQWRGGGGRRGWRGGTSTNPPHDARPPLCMASFMTSLKSLVRDGTLVRVGGCGSNYKVSDAVLRRRARDLEARADERMGSTTAATGGGGTTTTVVAHDYRALQSSTAAMTTATAVVPREVLDGNNNNYDDGCDNDRRRKRHYHPREEPPRELPKRRTFHSKIRMGDAETISAVVSSSSSSPAFGETTRKITARRLRRRVGHYDDDDGGMDTDDDNDRAAAVVKIVPRRVSPRRMYVSRREDGSRVALVYCRKKKINDAHRRPSWHHRLSYMLASHAYYIPPFLVFFSPIFDCFRYWYRAEGIKDIELAMMRDGGACARTGMRVGVGVGDWIWGK
ncbi:hypothetical protein ACHAXA_005081 [Cyclostephanos tholiformis]|uniref:H15 domain-containing protein n=1 Tax=Cyclostephanos tholiformis TaxID=382380 RepID=A0ABD3SSL1_9STRA